MPMRKESILFNEYWTGAFARGDLGPQSSSKYFNVCSSKEAAYILKGHQVPFHSKFGPHFDKLRSTSHYHTWLQCSDMSICHAGSAAENDPPLAGLALEERIWQVNRQGGLCPPEILDLIRLLLWNSDDAKLNPRPWTIIICMCHVAEKGRNGHRQAIGDGPTPLFYQVKHGHLVLPCFVHALLSK